ncbi:lipase family alpha/beta hydrolase [Luteimonas sp. B3_2_R+30]|uniref:Lipase family alpha/beta hydrolase n=2 Tax=Luteimonas salinilitoris TaxID=3237697 RepID=A0ABV4HM54_9GAMM
MEVKDEAVPIVFVPGIMGSNLRNKETGEAVWTPNSIFRLAWQWVFRGSATRQRKLNPKTTEVDDGGAFFGESATVPDGDTAKKRGWGTAAKFGYGKFIPWLDDTLNKDESTSPWESMEDKADILDAWAPEKAVDLLTSTDSETAGTVFCPVHCVGYNWLQSNGESGKYLVGKINEIIEHWQNGGEGKRTRYRCEKVILVTHSMGGLVSRAALHEAYGLEEDAEITNKVLGIVHGVMPALGAPAAYHHVRTGYDFPTGLVLGSNAAQITAVFANAPGALELLPNKNYPKGWLRAKDKGTGPDDGVMMRLPAANPYTEIYNQENKWYRLVDKELIDPAKIHGKAEVPLDPWSNVYRDNLRETKNFHDELGDWYFDPSYIHYGADEEIKTYQTLGWETADQVTLGEEALREAAVHGRKSDPVTLDMPERPKFKIPKASEPGDETVSKWSGAGPGESGSAAVKQSFKLTGIKHGSSYEDDAVQQSTLYAIGKLLGRLA